MREEGHTVEKGIFTTVAAILLAASAFLFSLAMDVPREGEEEG